jgi:hypothetical protein
MQSKKYILKVAAIAFYASHIFQPEIFVDPQIIVV